MDQPPSRRPKHQAENSSPAAVQLRKILVPVDFMESTIRVLQYAAAFAREYNATITILHCVKPDGADGRRNLSGERRLAELTEASEQQIRKLTTILWADEIQTEIVIATGSPFRQIINEARETNSDLIIMGGHGVVGSWGLFRRNTTAKVVNAAPCPVLVVRAFGNGFVPTGFPAKCDDQ